MRWESICHGSFIKSVLSCLPDPVSSLGNLNRRTGTARSRIFVSNGLFAPRRGPTRSSVAIGQLPRGAAAPGPGMEYVGHKQRDYAGAAPRGFGHSCGPEAQRHPGRRCVSWRCSHRPPAARRRAGSSWPPCLGRQLHRSARYLERPQLAHPERARCGKPRSARHAAAIQANLRFASHAGGLRRFPLEPARHSVTPRGFHRDPRRLGPRARVLHLRPTLRPCRKRRLRRRSRHLALLFRGFHGAGGHRHRTTPHPGRD